MRPCDCVLGRAHALHCPNYIEVDMPCPVCERLYGRHLDACPLAPESHDSGATE